MHTVHIWVCIHNIFYKQKTFYVRFVSLPKCQWVLMCVLDAVAAHFKCSLNVHLVQQCKKVLLSSKVHVGIIIRTIILENSSLPT